MDRAFGEKLPLGALILLIMLSGCGEKNGDNNAKPAGGQAVSSAPSPASGNAFPQARATATISGKVLFDGVPPAREQVSAGQIAAAKDDLCSTRHKKTPIWREDLLVEQDGAIRNAVVYVKRFPRKWSYATPKAAVRITQRGCAYVPHVSCVMANQPVVVSSDDGTTHNVHIFAKYSRIRRANFTQVKGNEETLKFKRAELGTAYFKCDIHSWMRAYICIFSHPFFAVTGADGAFALGKLPPGEYEIGVWHEKLGRKSRKVLVQDGETVELQFSLKQD